LVYSAFTLPKKILKSVYSYYILLLFFTFVRGVSWKQS